MVTAALDRTRDEHRSDSDVAWSAVTQMRLPARSHAAGLKAINKPREPAMHTGWWLVSVGLLLAVAAGAYRVSQSPSLDSAGGAAEAQVVRNVKVVQPERAATASVVLPATIRPWQGTTLHARVSGYLTAWHFDLGANVKAGQLLAEIETPELDQELAEGKALAAEAAAAAIQARAEREEARADLKVAEAQLTRIQAENQLAKAQLQRREKLLNTRAISRDDYDTFSTQVEARTAEVAAAESDVTRRRTNLQTRTAVIAVREATAKSRRANVERLEQLQVFKRIVAPFDGVVIRRTAEVGMLVTAGKESLYALEDMSRVRVQVNVPQSYAVATKQGVEATVVVPESTLPAVQAVVTRTSDSVDSTNRTMLAEIELDNASHRYQPGSYAQVTLVTEQDSGQWTVPANTVSMRVDGPHVAVLDQNDRIEIRPVTLGRDLGGRVVVAVGIQGPERLIVNPGDSLLHGDRVHPEQAQPQAQVAGR